MAAIHPPSSNHYEPQGRWGHCSAFVSGKIFMYGGHLTGPWLTQPPTVVDVFDPATEKWDQITTTGPPPPGFIYASCAVIGLYLYAFAGHNRSSYFNNMQELNTTNLKWTQLNDANQGEAPMAKAGAAMISYNEKILITIGGVGFLPNHRRSGTEYILDPDSPDRGWTNELLCFDVNARTWSSPHTTGTPPPASSQHSFTMVDLHRAVLYGGEQHDCLLPSHVYILDVQQWMWTTITGGGPSWPGARCLHSAVSLHHPDSDFIPDPAVMVMWGQANQVILSDCWVFHVNVRQWRKVTLPDTLEGQFGHSTTIVHTSSTLKKLVNYGGMDESPRNWRDPATYIPVAETTVIEIKSLMDVWVVTAVRQLGRRSVSSRPPTVLPDLPIRRPATLPTPWLTPALPIQQPPTWPTLFTGQQQQMPLPVQQPTTFQIHQPAQPIITAPIFQPYTPSYGHGVLEMQPELPLIPPIEEPALGYYDEYPLTLTQPHGSLPPTIPLMPVMSSTATHQIEAPPAVASFPQPTSDRGPLAAVQTTDSVFTPHITPTSYSHAPLQEPPLSDQESKPTIDVKPKLELASPTDEKPTLSELKTDPVSPDKKDIKPEEGKLDSEQGEESLLKEIALLRHIVAHQKKEIMGYQETVQMYRKSLQEGQTLPTSEQAVQTDGDVGTTEYLRGFESFAKTSFVITGSHSQTFEWEGYGLKLHIPEGAVPGDHMECRIDIKAGVAGQFSFPDDSQLVSCVYWIACSLKFLKPVTLDIEHCAAVQDSSQSSSLRFVAAKCSQVELPYQFKELKQATFSPQSSFGSVQVSQFSFFGITWYYKMFWWLRRYRANVYYIKRSISEWRLNFVITWSLLGFQKAVENVFAGDASDNHLSMAVEFQDDTITLEVPVDGEDLKNGWEITPLTPPAITKSQVDSFRPGQPLPSCCLSIEWTGEGHTEGNPIGLKHRIYLVGAKKPFNFFCIKLMPETPLTVMEGLGKHRRQKQVEDHHNGKPKREKLSHESKILTDKSLDIRTLRHELKDVTEWFQLGGELGVRHDKLKQIEQDCSRETERCKTEMLNCWLQGDPEASWIKVVEALQRMDRVVLAQQLQRKYMYPLSRDTPEVVSPSSSSDVGTPLVLAEVEELDEDNQLRQPLPHETTQDTHLPSESHPAPPKDPLQ